MLFKALRRGTGGNLQPAIGAAPAPSPEPSTGEGPFFKALAQDTQPKPTPSPTVDPNNPVVKKLKSLFG